MATRPTDERLAELMSGGELDPSAPIPKADAADADETAAAEDDKTVEAAASPEKRKTIGEAILRTRPGLAIALEG